MDITIIQNAIVDKQNEIQQLKIKTDNLQEEIIKKSKAFFKILIEKEIKSCFVNMPEQTKELSKEKQTELKSDMNNLLKKSDDIIVKIYNNNIFDLYQFMIKTGVETALREAANEIGLILKKYDYVKVKDNKVNNITNWMFKDINNKRILTLVDIDLGKDFIKIIENYKTSIDNLKTAAYKLDDLKKEKEKAEAEDLWEQA